MNTHLPAHLIAHINVKLALIGCSPVPLKGDREFVEIAAAMVARDARGEARLDDLVSVNRHTADFPFARLPKT